MSYKLFDSGAFKEIVSQGYPYMMIGAQLSCEDVGMENDGHSTHFVIEPVQEGQADAVGWLYDIGSPEVVDMVNGHFDVYFWIKAA